MSGIPGSTLYNHFDTLDVAILIAFPVYSVQQLYCWYIRWTPLVNSLWWLDLDHVLWVEETREFEIVAINLPYVFYCDYNEYIASKSSISQSVPWKNLSIDSALFEEHQLNISYVILQIGNCFNIRFKH